MSDLSSDVCSSDLEREAACPQGDRSRPCRDHQGSPARQGDGGRAPELSVAVPRDGISRREFGQPAAAHGAARGLARTAGGDARQGDHRGRLSADPRGVRRSEEHTSELQSLMRISYAVFCLKKKKNIRPPKKSPTQKE